MIQKTDFFGRVYAALIAKVARRHMCAVMLDPVCFCLCSPHEPFAQLGLSHMRLAKLKLFNMSHLTHILSPIQSKLWATWEWSQITFTAQIPTVVLH